MGFVLAMLTYILNGAHWSDCGMKLKLDEPLGKVGSWGFVCANIDIVCQIVGLVTKKCEFPELGVLMALLGILTGFSGVVLSSIQLAEGCGTTAANGTTNATTTNATITNATTNSTANVVELPEWFGPLVLWSSVAMLGLCCAAACLAVSCWYKESRGDTSRASPHPNPDPDPGLALTLTLTLVLRGSSPQAGRKRLTRRVRPLRCTDDADDAESGQ